MKQITGLRRRGSFTTPKQEIVYSRQFHTPHCTISLRPFSAMADLPVVCNRYWSSKDAARLIAESYRFAGESNFARSYLVLLNDNIPVCQADLCRAQQDEAGEYFTARPGDYVIRLLTNKRQKISRTLYGNLVQTCLEYFFLLPNTERIIAEAITGDSLQNEMLLQAGFSFEQTICQPYKDANLYYCTRAAYLKSFPR